MPDTPDNNDLIATTSALIGNAVSRLALGDDVWWSISPTLVPHQQGPRAVYVIFMHIKSPLVGQVISTFSVIDNPFSLLSEDVVRANVQELMGGLRDAVSQSLSSTSPT